jgi:hypothetical protein
MIRFRKEFLACLVWLAFLGLDSTAYADSPNIPQEIREKLERNAAELNPITLAWTDQKQFHSDVGKVANLLGTPNDYGMDEKNFWVFMWQDLKGYALHSSKSAISVQSGTSMVFPLVGDKNIEKELSTQERSFNGEVYCGGFGRVEKSEVPGLGIYPLRYFDTHPIMNTFYQRYTIRMGYKFPSIGRELGSPVQSYILFLCENGKLLETSEITEKVKKFFYIAARGYDPWEDRERDTGFCLDPDYHYAVVRSEIKTLEGELAYSISNEKFEKLPGKEIYLPKKTSVQHFTGGANQDTISAPPLFTEEFVMTEVSTNKIPDKQFDLRLKYTAPGVHVGDRTLADTEFGIQYRIPANPADRDRVIEAIRTGTEFVPTPFVSTRVVIIRWVTGILGLAMIFLALYRMFMKKVTEPQS